MADVIDIQRAALVPEDSPAVMDGLLSRTVKHTLTAYGSKWRKAVENEVLFACAFFYRRFFTTYSPASYDPTAVLLSCLNLACKTEESHSITMKDLLVGNDVFTCPEETVNIELAILKAIEFELSVEQPWPAVMWFAAKIADRGKLESAQKLFDEACELIGSWQWTDAILVFSAGKLASAACLAASKKVGVYESFTESLTVELGVASIDETEKFLESILSVVSRHVKPHPDVIDSFSEKCKQIRLSDQPAKRRRKKST